MSNIATWRKFSEEEIREIVASSSSSREVARKLGYAQNGGGTMASLKKMYQELNIDISHFSGQGWNKNNFNYDIFSEFSYKKNGSSTAKALIALRGQVCEKCGLTQWLDLPINLEVHHRDGDRTNNSLENLMLLCPNCHSYTSTFAKKGDKREISDDEFVVVLKGSKTIREALKYLNLTDGNNYERANYLIYKYNLHHLMK